MEEGVNNFDVIDVENYTNDEKSFNHQILIMNCLKKCADNGAVEMREGFKKSVKNSKGEIEIVYQPDTRKCFIESIKTAKNFMVCDFDNEAKEKIETLIKELNEKKKFFLYQQDKWFNSLPFETKRYLEKETGGIMLGTFNIRFDYYNLYITEELEIYRRILEELNHLTKRLDFYSEDIYTG